MMFRVGLAALAVLLAWHASGIGQIIARALVYPFELDYGEGIVWFQMKQLFAGTAYGDINRFGGIVFHYTPFYHFVTGLVAEAGIDGLAAGRGVSAVSTVAMILLVAAITRLVLKRADTASLPATIAGLLAGSALLLCFPVKVWAPLMRVDMLATALTLGGVWCGLKAIERPGMIFPAAILFVLAVYTKQTMIAAPASLFGLLLIYRPRSAVIGIITCMAVGGAAMAALAMATDGGFLRHIFLYNVNRYAPDRFAWYGLMGMGHISLIAAAAAGVALKAKAIVGFLRRRREADADQAAAAFLGLYLLLTTASLLLLLKSGSGVNYFIEWMAVLTIFAGIALGGATAYALSGSAGANDRSATFAGVFALIALSIQAATTEPSRYNEAQFSERVAGLTQLTERARRADKPIISDDMVLLIRAGKPVVWEPAIFAELGSNGVWDQRPLVRLIEEERFAFFITNQKRGGNLFRDRFNPPIADAIEKHYPKLERTVGLTVHSPANVNDRAAPAGASAGR